MHRVSHQPRRGLGALLLIVASVVVVGLLGPAPCLAAPTPTVLTVAARSTNVVWGSTAVLNGVLQTTEDPPLPVGGQQIVVQYATSSTGPWHVAGTITNSGAAYYAGAYAYSWTAARNYYWFMDFAGTAQYAPFPSNIVYVKVRPALGRPHCPASIHHGKKLTVYGSLKPKFPAGSETVKVRVQVYKSHKWRSYAVHTAVNVNSGSYSKYKATFAISAKGKFRFYATTSRTNAFAAGRSTFSRTLRVY